MKAFLNAVFWLLLVAGLIFLAVFGSTAAFAQTQQCATYAQVRTHLATRYREDVIWVGLTPRDIQLALYVAEDGGTWTVVTVVGERACMIASGTGWSDGEGIPPVTPTPPGTEN
jgi:hypothetical protein